MNLENVSTKELFLELLTRPEVDITREYTYWSNMPLDMYAIELDFHLSDEELNKCFKEK